MRNAARKDMGLNVVVNTKARYMEIMRWLAHSDIAVPGAPAAAPAAPPPVDAPAEPAAPAAPDAVDRFFASWSARIWRRGQRWRMRWVRRKS